MRGFIAGTAIGLIGGVVLAAVVADLGTPPPASPPSNAAEPAAEQPRIEAPVLWRLASQFPPDLPETGKLAIATAGRIETLSQGTVHVEVYDPGALVPPLDVLDAVATGAVEAAFALPGYWGETSVALELFGGIPFGPGAAEFLAWYHHGGGRAIHDEIYNDTGVQAILCGLVGMAGGGWFRQAIGDVAELDRVPVAAMGLAARVLERAGAQPVRLAPSDLPAAYESGGIAGAVFLTPAADRQLMRGLAIEHYYFPSWQQQFGAVELLINLEAWNALTSRARDLFEIVCNANLVATLADSEADQFTALKEIVKDGIDVRRLPRSVTDDFRTAWHRTVDELVQSDADFRRAWASLSAFREDYAIWRELGLPRGEAVQP